MGDHHHFLSYFHALEQALPTLIAETIPESITRECAEFATGRLEVCATADCGKGICILCADEEQFEVDPSKMREKWSFCSLSKQYFCSDCLACPPNLCSRGFC